MGENHVDKDQMRKVGMLVGVLMGLLISLVMSIVGPLIFGHCTIVAVLVSFVCSSIISILVGLFVPIKKIMDSCCAAIKVEPMSIPGRIVSALVSDLCFTPLLTFLMVFMNYKRASQADPNLSFGKMFVGNFIVSYIVAFVLVLVFNPLLVKLSIKILTSASSLSEEDESEEK